MIRIAMDEAEAYDRLSILECKKAHAPSPEQREEFVGKIKELMIEINEGIGYDLGRHIYLSEEYRELYLANFELFALIDESKKITMMASCLDRANYKRFEAKQKLQAKFFSKDLQEKKLGYD